MLPMEVLWRLDCVLEPSKDVVLKHYAKLTAQNMPDNAMERLLGKAADPSVLTCPTISARSHSKNC